MWTASYFADISGGATNLVVTPEQHRVATVGDTTATRRLYSSLDLRLFYADAGDANAKFATAPAISKIGAASAGGVVRSAPISMAPTPSAPTTSRPCGSRTATARPAARAGSRST